MENWILSIIGVAITGASAFAVLKNKVTNLVATAKEQSDKINKLQRFVDEKRTLLQQFTEDKIEINKELRRTTEEVSHLREKINQAASVQEVAATYVTKEYYNQIEKHIEANFKRIEGTLQQILGMMNEIIKK